MRRLLTILAALFLSLIIFTGCADSRAAARARARIDEIPVLSEGLVFYGDNYVTVRGEDYFLPSVASKLLSGRKPDLYQNTSYYGQNAAYYTIVYDRNNDRREEEGCNIALFCFDYATGKGKLLRDMKGTFPVQSYNMASPTVLQRLDEAGGNCVLVRNGALEIVSVETGDVVWSQQVFGAKDYFAESSQPFAFRGLDMIFAFHSETVRYYRYTGTMYEMYTFESELFKGLTAGSFDTALGALYVESGNEIVFAADILSGEARDTAEIAAFVAAQERERETVREQGNRFEHLGSAYRVKADEGTVFLTPEAGGTVTIDIAALCEKSEEMRMIKQIYAEEFPDKTLDFSLDYVVSNERLFLAAAAKIQGYGLVDLFTPTFVFEYGLSGGGFTWAGYHAGGRLFGVRFL